MHSLQAHRTFSFGKITIDSDFDSGNCSNAEKHGNNTFAIWLACDHPKADYRVWFYFSIEGIAKNSVINFVIKNMQDMSRLIYDGFTPVVKDEEKQIWERISHKINFNHVIVGENQMEFTFQHRFSSNKKHFFAFTFPWSTEQNFKFLNYISAKVQDHPSNIYLYRGPIIYSLQNRQIQMVMITSDRSVSTSEHRFNDNYLFPKNKPKKLKQSKPAIIISARVHPGQVPGSHVMNGIIQQLTQDTLLSQKLRQTFVFYIFPILNPDGVFRGHHRMDTKGINLNRSYLNPSFKDQPSIYAVKKIVMQCHRQDNYFAYLDLHAQPSKNGNFIYGNSLNQLKKQVQACLFPRLLSMNTEHFEYEGSNFMQKHMYHKDKSDHMSKQGCGRVALYYATKNPKSWTLQCGYNMSSSQNILQQKIQKEQTSFYNQNNINPQLIKTYKSLPVKASNLYYSIQTYHSLGKSVLQTFLDMVDAHPCSRINNSLSLFKNIQNIRLNLAYNLLKMSPNRFQSQLRKIYFAAEGAIKQQMLKRCMKALYFKIIKNANIPNMASYLKGQSQTIILPKTHRKSFTTKFKSTNIKIKNDLKTSENQLQTCKSQVLTDIPSLKSIDSLLPNHKNSLFQQQKEPKGKLSVKIIDIQRQVNIKRTKIDVAHLKSINNRTSRYQTSGKYDLFSSFKSKNQKNSMQQTYTQLFKIKILPKLIKNNKAALNIRCLQTNQIIQ